MIFLLIGTQLSLVIYVGMALVIGFLCGFCVRLGANAKLKGKVQGLENEMVDNHAEILNLTAQLVQQEDELLRAKTNVPVITINGTQSQGGKKTIDGKLN